jgi:hypothetical protein
MIKSESKSFYVLYFHVMSFFQHYCTSKVNYCIYKYTVLDV